MRAPGALPARLLALYQHRRRQWLARHAGPTDSLLLSWRRVYIVPVRAGLGFVLLLTIMLIGALNYNLGLGFALTFFTGACAVAGMFLTARNLSMLRLTPGRAAPVFAGEEAQFELLLHNPTHHARYAIQVGIDADARAGTGNGRASRWRAAQAADVAPKTSTSVLLAVATHRRGWLPAPRVRLLTYFPLGLFRAWSYWQPAPQALSVLVYPAPETPPQPLPSHGAASAEGHGAVGLDNFAGIRSYQPGDPLRQLAWRQIARLDPGLGGALLAKQFDGGAVAELTLDFAALPSQLDLELRLSRMTQWVLQAELRALPYRFCLGRHDYGPALGDAHRAACLRALALHGAADHQPPSGDREPA
ncbi:MAG: DUF58 domain-containing protein [Duganella sp.]